MGVMASLTNVGRFETDQRIFEIDADFTKIALDNHFRLYLQAENISQAVNYQDYYGCEIYDRFKSLKDSFDPHNLLNPGIFFPDDSTPPMKASLGRVFSDVFSKLL